MTVLFYVRFNIVSFHSFIIPYCERLLYRHGHKQGLLSFSYLHWRVFNFITLSNYRVLMNIVCIHLFSLKIYASLDIWKACFLWQQRTNPSLKNYNYIIVRSSGRSGLATDWNDCLRFFVFKMINNRVRPILIKCTIVASGHTYLRLLKTP